MPSVALLIAPVEPFIVAPSVGAGLKAYVPPLTVADAAAEPSAAQKSAILKVVSSKGKVDTVIVVAAAQVVPLPGVVYSTV